MTTCFVAFGGNLGDVAATFSAAADALAATPGVSLAARSRTYRTRPMGDAAAPAYLNAAVELDTQLTPEVLLTEMQRIENRFGRTREQHWGSRTLDLDLLAAGTRVVATPRLTLPHPLAWHRRFVLDPWCELSPEWTHPVLGETVRAMRERLLVRPLPVHADAEELRRRLSRREDVVVVEDSTAAAIRFVSEHSARGPRNVLVPSGAAGGRLADDVLTAALDDPQPLVSTDDERGGA
ncbi:MAG: 2-amino-4-hydroxy-6-hydroxymethyldihydropteridine diphosphokinase [Planctomyces sp.]|nr:2-amino-4-hydroxy-6-hydroxymethyldihydropteridine diphosphokinase [Planctomyces sp.]